MGTIAATGVWLATAGLIAQQESRPTFRAGINRVSLHVVVKDHRGRTIKNLIDTDFQIFDQGRAVRIDDFYAGEDPISLALLIDTSGSMRLGARLASARQAVDTLLAQLQPDDQAALFTFDLALREVVAFSNDLSNLRRGLDRVDPFGSTSLHDAVAAVAERSAARPSSRRGVVAITDGLDNSSQLSATAASGVASANDVPVYVLTVASAAGPIDAREIALEPIAGGGVARLDELTARTGGASFAAETPAEALVSVRQILTDLRTGYVLAFTPDTAPGWHQLTVRVTRKDARVRTRSGFWMGAPAR